MPDTTSLPGSSSNQLRSPKSIELFLYLLAPGLLCIFVYALWPYLQYCVDPDSISYMNIVQNYLKADYTHAINSFWSPMGCWLTALAVKMTGWQIFGTALFVNTIGTSLLTLANQVLFHRFRTSLTERIAFAVTSAVFWTYAIYFQPFTDLWQYLFLTLGLLILTNRSYLTRWPYWILLGVLGALAYFSKAYSFYFFPLMVFIATCFHLMGETKFNWKKLLTICFFAGATMFILAFPWLYLIHEKYHIWTSSTAGKLNASWFLVGHQEFRDDIHILLPPPYKGSLFYFEDPYLAQGPIVHFYDSGIYVLKLIARIGYNCFNWVKITSGISPFFVVIWISVFVLAFKRGILKNSNIPMKIIAGVLITYPLPFFLFTFESGRYIWFLMCVSIILGLHFADPFLEKYYSKKTTTIFIILLFFTFTVKPVLEIKDMLHNGEQEHAMAASLKELGIEGSFLSNKSYEEGSASMIRLSWFSQNPWYCYPKNEYPTLALLQDAARYNVKYYFYFYKGTGNDYQARGLNGELLTEVTGNKIPGLKVFQLE